MHAGAQARGGPFAHRLTGEIHLGQALIESSCSGVVRMIGMADFGAVLREVRPSTGPWFSSARGVAMFANEGGAHDELVAYFREHPNE